MRINQIITEYAIKSQKREFLPKKFPEEPVKTLFEDGDSVEISGNLTPERLSELKKRVSTGFYFNQSVTDDVSNKMSGLFDDLTQ